jgi:NADH-quinone oxidoreductase subunit J
MNVEQLVFGAMFVVALGSSMAMILAKNAVHTALFLVAAQIALALAFLLQGAFFVAAIQVILYAGAIMVLFLFVIMLLGVDRKEPLIEPLPGQRPLAIGMGMLLAAQILWISIRGTELIAAGEDRVAGLESLNRDPGNVKSIAEAVFGRYVFPFEATSILLVVGIVGVMALARRIGHISTVPSVFDGDTTGEQGVGRREGAA